jgi:hypothetical protein
MNALKEDYYLGSTTPMKDDEVMKAMSARQL